MIQIIRLQGTDKKLYQLVAPLVMNPEVLKQNYNYPFRTSENFEWFVALENSNVMGFVPVEYKKSECIINNYYIKEKHEDTLKLLLKEIVEVMDQDKYLTAVIFLDDKAVFEEFGFLVEKVWTRYVRMRKDRRL